jgi:lipoate-protein ligase A
MALVATRSKSLARPPIGRVIIERGAAPAKPRSVAIAIDEALGESVGSGASPPVLRVWQGDRAIVVPRRRLRNQRGPALYNSSAEAWPICPRNSGGGAVAHGPGTLNLSLVLPREAPFEPSIEDGYRAWAEVLHQAMRDEYGLVTEVGRIEGTFCSGDFDIGIGGRKIAGVAQMRRRSSVVVHGTILVSVDVIEYLRHLTFVDRLLGGSSEPTRYRPSRLVSLHELTVSSVTTADLALALAQAANAAGHVSGACTRSELARARQLAV